MPIVFWDAKGIIFVDYFQKAKIITGKYYARLLQHLKDGLQKTTPSGEENNHIRPSSNCSLIIFSRFSILQLSFVA